jgi:VWFA-related protein
MNRGIRSLYLVCVVVFALIYATAQNKQDASSSQQPPASQQPFKLTVGTHLVLVPAIVSDKRGAHVPGLKAADFEVKEDGKTEEIVRVDEVTTADAGKVERTPSATDGKTFTNRLAVDHPKKLTIICLDQVNTPFTATADGHRMLIEFLVKTLDANTLLALVAMQHNGVRVLHNFTSDPQVLVAAVKKVQMNLTSHDTRSTDNAGDNSEADLEALQLTALLNNTDMGAALAGGGGNAGVAAARAQSAAQRAQVDFSHRAQDALITLNDFQQLAQYFGGIPGRKSLIWASAGFPYALGTVPQANTPGPLFDDWERTFRMLSDANISVYPVDISGLLPGANANTIQNVNSALIKTNAPDGGSSAKSAQLDAVNSGAYVDSNIGRQETLRQVADMTGGQAYYNSNNGAELFRRAADDSSQYYILAYYTKDAGKPGWRKLNVKVARDGVKVRARSGFFFDNSPGKGDAARQAEEMMAMVSDLNFGSLPIDGRWGQVQPDGNNRKLRFQLSVPAGIPYIDTTDKNHINFDFRVVITDASGQAVGKIGQRLETNLPDDEAEKIRTSGLDYVNEVSLPPGQYKAHFVVRDNLRGALGSIVTPVKVE